MNEIATLADRYWKAVDEQGVTIDVLTWLETEPAEKEWDALALRLGLDIDKWKHKEGDE